MYNSDALLFRMLVMFCADSDFSSMFSLMVVQTVTLSCLCVESSCSAENSAVSVLEILSYIMNTS